MHEHTPAFAVFHVTHRANRATIESKGLLSRRALAEHRVSFRDIADEALKKQVFRRHTLLCVWESGDVSRSRPEWDYFVPCYFLKPLSQPEVIAAEVEVWRDRGLPLDVWLVAKSFLANCDHVICLGDPSSADPSIGRPILIRDLPTFITLLRDTAVRSEIARWAPDVSRFLSADVPHMLVGPFGTTQPKQSDTSYLLKSTLYVRYGIPTSGMERVDLDRLGDLRNDARYVFRVTRPDS